MSFEITLRPDLDAYTETVPLDGVDFDLSFLWNERDQQHYLSVFATDSPILADGSRVAIATSIPILVGAFLLQDVPGRNRPLGDLLPLDTSGKDKEAGRGELGVRVVLVYIPQTEAQAIV